MFREPIQKMMGMSSVLAPHAPGEPLSTELNNDSKWHKTRSSEGIHKAIKLTKEYLQDQKARHHPL